MRSVLLARLVSVKDLVANKRPNSLLPGEPARFFQKRLPFQQLCAGLRDPKEWTTSFPPPLRLPDVNRVAPSVKKC